jgi:hypothetical protein
MGSMQKPTNEENGRITKLASRKKLHIEMIVEKQDTANLNYQSS